MTDTDLKKENEELRRENERLMMVLAESDTQMQASAYYWRSQYISLGTRLAKFHRRSRRSDGKGSEWYEGDIEKR